MGTVPIALRSNRYGLGLSEEEGSIVVDSPDDMAEAAGKVLQDRVQLHDLSVRAIKAARAVFDWEPFVERVRDCLRREPRDESFRRVRHGMAQAIEQLIDTFEGEIHEAREETRKRIAEYDRFRERRAVRIAARVADLLGHMGLVRRGRQRPHSGATGDETPDS